jgi:hypothetical protein
MDRMGRRLVHFTILCAFVVGVGIAAAADLQDRTRRAYDEYAERATRVFVDHARDGASGAASSEPSRSVTIDVRPAREDGILSVPSGLVHHWAGSTFISGVTLQDALDVSFEYGAYHKIYTPVVASKLLGRDGRHVSSAASDQGIGWRPECHPRCDIPRAVFLSRRPPRLQHLDIRRHPRDHARRYSF